MNALKKGIRIAGLAVILTALALMGIGTFTVFGSGPLPWAIFGVCAITVASYFKGERYIERRVQRALATARKTEPLSNCPASI